MNRCMNHQRLDRANSCIRGRKERTTTKFEFLDLLNSASGDNPLRGYGLFFRNAP